MQTEPTSEPTGSPVPGVIPEPIHARSPASRGRAKLVSALRGDKYAARAYPPDWHGADAAAAADRTKRVWVRVMRNRHVPRLCRHCQAPMASQEDTCWRCGTEWASEAEPRTTLRLIPGNAHRHVEDDERWPNEGGNIAAEVTAPLPATAARQ